MLGTIVAFIALAVASISVIMYAVVVQHLLDNKNVPQPPITKTNDTPSEGMTEEYKKGYNDCHEFILSAINITMFDLWRTHDVLDFESNMEEFMSRMTHIILDDAYRETTVKDYEEYREGKQ